MNVASYLAALVIICVVSLVAVSAERRAARAHAEMVPQIAAALAAAQAQTITALTEAAKAITAPYSGPDIAAEPDFASQLVAAQMARRDSQLVDQRDTDDDSDQTDWLVPAPYTRPDAAVLGADMTGNPFGIPGLEPIPGIQRVWGNNGAVVGYEASN